MVGCSVISCKRRSETSNSKQHGVSYHKFPNWPSLRKEWVIFCRRDDKWVPKRTSVICSDHFEPQSFVPNIEPLKKLTEYAKPTILNEACPYQKSDITSTIPNDDINSSNSADFVFVAVPGSHVPPIDKQKATVIEREQSSTLIHSPDCVPLMTSSTKIQLMESAREKKLLTKLKASKMKIRRLQARIRYLEKKVQGFQELFDD